MALAGLILVAAILPATTVWAEAQAGKGDGAAQCVQSRKQPSESASADNLSDAIATKVAAGMPSTDIDKYLKNDLCLTQLTKGRELPSSRGADPQPSDVTTMADSTPFQHSDPGDAAIYVSTFYNRLSNHYYAVSSYEWKNNDYVRDEWPDQCAMWNPTTAVGGRDGFGVRLTTDKLFDNLAYSMRLWGDPAHDGKPGDFEGGPVDNSHAYADGRGVFYTWQDNVTWADLLTDTPACIGDIDYDAYGGVVVLQMDIIYNSGAANECRYAQTFGQYSHTYDYGKINGASISLTDFVLGIENVADSWEINANTYPSYRYCPNRTSSGSRPPGWVDPPDCNCSSSPPATAKRKADLVVHGESAPYNWAVATSNGESFAEWSDIGLSGWSMGDWSGLADVTGDGLADLVVHNTQYQRFDVAVADGTGRFGGPGTGTWLNQWAAGDWAGLGDVNGDGKADLVVHGESAPYNWAVALSNGSSFGGWSGIGLDWWSMGDFAGLADVTGDGRADLVVHGEGGSYDWAVAVADGTGHFGAAGTGVWLSGWSMGNFAGLGDVDGDGKADLVVHGESAPYNWAVALSNGSSFGGWSGIGLSGWSMGDFAGLADVTGDGKADLVVHNPGQQRYDVAVADGTGHFGAAGTGTWLVDWAAGQFVGLANINGT